MDAGYNHHHKALTFTAKTMARNLFGAFLILVISLLSVIMILVPEMLRLFHAATVSGHALEWISVIGSILIIGILIVFPILLIVQGGVYYRDALDLERFGTLTKGSVTQKWVDLSDGKPIYHILYIYSRGLRAMQTVDEEVFRSLQLDQIIDVLHLEHATNISRLELDQ